MILTDAATPSDPKARDLARMRVLATGLLLLMALIYVAASAAAHANPALVPGLGYVRAFAEAGMAGACADWFAVTALFRRPLGLPIPHTGIIPRNKARIGKALGGFIADNFLTVEVLDAKLRQLEVARWGGAWLAEPRHARLAARRIAGLLPEFLPLLPPHALRDAAGSAALAVAKAVPAAPMASKVLAAVWSEGRSQTALEWAIGRLAAWLEANTGLIQAGVEARSSKWLPKWVDRMIAEKIASGVLKQLEEMREPDHPWRQEIRQWIETMIARLETDPELLQSGEALKARLLAEPALAEQARAVWAQLEGRLSAGRGHALAERLEQILLTLGAWLAADEGAQVRLNDWARLVVRRLIAPRRAEIGRLIAEVVAGWDARSITDKLELQVGRDLQYIRINGTIVGGVVGLAIYALARAAGW